MHADLIEVGKIVNTKGLSGEVKVTPWCDSPSDFEQFPKISCGNVGAWRDFTVQAVKYVKGSVLLKLLGVDSLKQAQALVGETVYASRSYFKHMDEDTYFIQDLIGLSVVLEDGSHFGVLKDIFQTGSNDVYCVKTEAHGMLYLPCIKDVVKKISLENKTITVHLLDGLLE